MKVIGIVGGVACGKSVVARQLQGLGAALIDVDGLGHSVLRDAEVIGQVQARWGINMLDETGQIDRKKLAAIVFAANRSEDLRHLESITHPRIGDRIRAEIARLADTRKYRAAVLDAAVMLKAGWHEHCDVIVFVDCPQNSRRARAMQRGWTTEQFESRESSQIAIDRKRALANIVIDNSGTLDQTYGQVRDLWTSFSI